jgi:hypothetical protein
LARIPSLVEAHELAHDLDEALPHPAEDVVEGEAPSRVSRLV